MDYYQSVELLEATHDFPCPYTIKVIGRSEPGFVGRVLRAVRMELGEHVEPPFRLRHTAGGRHIAVTLEPTVETGVQVLSLYELIRVTDGVIFLM